MVRKMILLLFIRQSESLSQFSLNILTFMFGIFTFVFFSFPRYRLARSAAVSGMSSEGYRLYLTDLIVGECSYAVLRGQILHSDVPFNNGLYI